jgi:membrane protease YdiL (CAAX protease family)
MNSDIPPHNPNGFSPELVSVQPQSFTERYRISPLVFLIVALIGIFISYQLIGGTLIVLLFGAQITEANVVGMRIATMAGQLLFMLVPTIILARLQTIHLKDLFRLHAPRPLEIVLAVLSTFGLQGVLQVYVHYQDKIPIPESIKPIFDELRRMVEELYRSLIAAHSVPELIFVTIVVAVTPAVCEELFFRGLIQKNLEQVTTQRRRNALWAVMFGGIIFSAYHLNPFGFVPVAVLGMYFGFLVYRANSIYVAVAAHFTNNFLAVLSLYVLGDEELFLKTEPHITDAIVLTNLALFLFFFLGTAYAFIRVTSRRMRLEESIQRS